MIAPPAIFAAFVALAAVGMFRPDKDNLPSKFIGQPAPPVPEAALSGYPPLTRADLTAGQVTMVNFWASWCPPCRAEHPTLLQLQRDGIAVYGVNFKDKEDQARAYLQDEGNPFLGIGFDPNGRNAIEWGVTAPPETFIIAGDGTVLYKFIGPLVGSDLDQRFLPELKKALDANVAN